MNTIVFLLPVALFFMSWGVGSFFRTISIIRGRNRKSSFWLPAILHPILIILFFILGSFIPAENSFSVICNVVVIGTIAFGVLAPILNFGVKWSYPDVFSKASLNQTKASQSYKDVNTSDISRKEPQPVIQEKSSDQKNQPYYPFDSMNSEPKPGSVTGQIFISYRRSDSADISGRIYDRLVTKFGREPIFKDVYSIPLGCDFKEYIDRMVGESNVLLAIIGDSWLDAKDETGKKRIDDPLDFVRIEIESALERGIPVIPLLVRGAKVPREESLPPSLRKLVYRNGIPVRPDPDFHQDMDRLISALEKHLR